MRYEAEEINIQLRQYCDKVLQAYPDAEFFLRGSYARYLSTGTMPESGFGDLDLYIFLPNIVDDNKYLNIHAELFKLASEYPVIDMRLVRDKSEMADLHETILPYFGELARVR